MRYEITGTDRQAHAIGIFTHFVTQVDARDESEARDKARARRYAEGREWVVCERVREVSA